MRFAPSKGIEALKNDSSQIEEVVRWEEGKSFAVVSRDAPLVDEVVGGMSVTPIDATTTEVVIDMTYTPRWGLPGKILDRLVLRTAFRLVLKRVAKGLQSHMESTELAEKAWA